MAGIIDWVSKRMKRPDTEIAGESFASPRPDDGVYVSPTPITAGDEISIKYTGALAKTGVEQLTLRMGYGHHEWTDVRDIPMSKLEGAAFEAKVGIPLEQCSRLQFCFRDDDGNWDNNLGRDWSYEIHCGEQAKFR